MHEFSCIEAHCVRKPIQSRMQQNFVLGCSTTQHKLYVVVHIGAFWWLIAVQVHFSGELRALCHAHVVYHALLQFTGVDKP